MLKHLRDNDIPLEVCISSNLATGGVASLSGHPLRRLYDAGVPITLNTDDPTFFGVSLTDEYVFGAERGLSQADLEAIRQNAFTYAF